MPMSPLDARRPQTRRGACGEVRMLRFAVSGARAAWAQLWPSAAQWLCLGPEPALFRSSIRSEPGLRLCMLAIPGRDEQGLPC